MKNNTNAPHKWWAPIPRFLAHTFVGVAIFLIVGAPAVGLEMLVHELAARKLVSAFTITVLGFLEHALLIIDSCVLLVYLVYAAYTAMRENGKD